MATSISRIRVRPAKDEWGVYDPQQAGIAALMARIDKSKTAPATTPATPAAPAKETKDAAPHPRPSLRDAQ